MREKSAPGFSRPGNHICSAVVLVMIASGTVRALPGGVRPYSRPANLTAYFNSRYPQITTVTDQMEATPEGPLGSFSVHGRLVPRVIDGTGTPEDRARAIARAFVLEEAQLLDLVDAAEIRDSPVTYKDNGTAVVHFSRDIGGIPLAGYFIRIEVKVDGAISVAHASLVPSPSDLYAAVRRDPISQDEVRTIVERDLTIPGQPRALTIDEPALGARWQPPYVVWDVHGAVGIKPAWFYSIDAFKGKILSRICTAVTFREAPPGQSLCD